MKKAQKSVDDWKFNARIQSLENERKGLLSWNKKPPATPKTRTSNLNRRVSTDGRYATAQSEGAPKTPAKPGLQRKDSQKAGRPFSDQGGRVAPVAAKEPKERMSVYSFFKSLKPSKPAW